MGTEISANTLLHLAQIKTRAALVVAKQVQTYGPVDEVRAANQSVATILEAILGERSPILVQSTSGASRDVASAAKLVQTNSAIQHAAIEPLPRFMGLVVRAARAAVPDTKVDNTQLQAARSTVVDGLERIDSDLTKAIRRLGKPNA